MRGVIDRFEGNFAVVELDNRSIINIDKEAIPCDAKEGDVLDILKDSIIINKTETLKRKEEIETLVKGLWED